MQFGTANARYAKAIVAGVKGVILFPDEYVHPDGVMDLSKINDHAANFTDNTLNQNSFGLMQTNGAVFLPAAGYRAGTNVAVAGTNAHYWSATPYGTIGAYSVDVRDGFMSVIYANPYRYRGKCVRLVHPAVEIEN